MSLLICTYPPCPSNTANRVPSRPIYRARRERPSAAGRPRDAGVRGPVGRPLCCRTIRRRSNRRTRAAASPRRCAVPCARQGRNPPIDRSGPSRSERRGPGRRGHQRRAAPYRDRGPDSTTCGTRVSRRSPRTGARLTNELPGDVGVVPPFHFGRLVALELLVGREEALDLAKPVLSEVAQGSHLVEPRIADRYAEYFFVVAMLVAHEQRADRTRWHDATREGRLFDNDQRVQRVAVPTDGVHDEAVIGGIVHRREQDTIETNASGRLIELVFGARASRDLYEDVNALILAPAPHAPAPPRSWPAPRPP